MVRRAASSIVRATLGLGEVYLSHRTNARVAVTSLADCVDDCCAGDIFGKKSTEFHEMGRWECRLTGRKER